MKKKELKKQNEALLQKLLTADSIIDGLKKEIIERDEKIAGYKATEELLKSKIVIDEPKPQEKKEEAEQEAAFEKEDFEFINNDKPSNDCSAEDYAVQTIANIILAQAKVNCVLGSDTQKAEEFSVLAETAKQNVFAALKTDDGLEQKKCIMDAELLKVKNFI